VPGGFLRTWIWIFMPVFAYSPPKLLIQSAHAMCLSERMAGAKHFTELVIWQLADQLRKEVIALTQRPPLVRD